MCFDPYFFSPPSPICCFSGGQQSEVDVGWSVAQLINPRVAVTAGGSGSAGVKVAVVRGFVKCILYTLKVQKVAIKPILSLLSYQDLFIEQNEPHPWQSLLQLTLLYSYAFRNDGIFLAFMPNLIFSDLFPPPHYFLLSQV